MTINIDDHKEISVIKEEFNIAFPYLKLEFFKQNKPGEKLLNTLINQNHKVFTEFRIARITNIISITPDMTVTEMEQKFIEIYGLGVLVFRKSGKAWLETTFTDGWTLEEQNRQGEALSKKELK